MFGPVDYTYQEIGHSPSESMEHPPERPDPKAAVDQMGEPAVDVDHDFGDDEGVISPGRCVIAVEDYARANLFHDTSSPECIIMEKGSRDHMLLQGLIKCDPTRVSKSPSCIFIHFGVFEAAVAKSSAGKVEEEFEALVKKDFADYCARFSRQPKRSKTHQS